MDICGLRRIVTSSFDRDREETQRAFCADEFAFANRTSGDQSKTFARYIDNFKWPCLMGSCKRLIQDRPRRNLVNKTNIIGDDDQVCFARLG